MKIVDILVEYKNKYYKPVPKKQKKRAKKTLWYQGYENWVTDIQLRFPNAKAYFDEENEEIIAGCDACKETYGKWSKKNKAAYKGVSFNKPRDISTVSKNKDKLKLIKDDT